jgi:hypothetical protein
MSWVGFSLYCHCQAATSVLSAGPEAALNTKVEKILEALELLPNYFSLKVILFYSQPSVLQSNVAICL